MGMQIKDISDKAFSAYGKVITGLDVTGILKEMEHTPSRTRLSTYHPFRSWRRCLRL